jgi:hypothetical protein
MSRPLPPFDPSKLPPPPSDAAASGLLPPDRLAQFADSLTVSEAPAASDLDAQKLLELLQMLFAMRKPDDEETDAAGAAPPTFQAPQTVYS